MAACTDLAVSAAPHGSVDLPITGKSLLARKRRSSSNRSPEAYSTNCI